MMAELERLLAGCSDEVSQLLLLSSVPLVPRRMNAANLARVCVSACHVVE